MSSTKEHFSGADPGFFLGGGALVSCSTSTPINHIVFFCRIPVVLENRRSSQGVGVRTPCTLSLDPPLLLVVASFFVYFRRVSSLTETCAYVELPIEVNNNLTMLQTDVIRNALIHMLLRVIFWGPYN